MNEQLGLSHPYKWILFHATFSPCTLSTSILVDTPRRQWSKGAPVQKSWNMIPTQTMHYQRKNPSKIRRKICIAGSSQHASLKMPEVWSLLAPQKKLSANFCWGGFQNHIHQKLAEKSFSKCRPLFLLSNVKALKTVKRCDSPHKLWSLPCWKEAISQYEWRQVIFFRVNIAGYTLRMICGLVSEWVFRRRS